MVVQHIFHKSHPSGVRCAALNFVVCRSVVAHCILCLFAAGHVTAAHELGAIQTLLVTDSLFRVNNIAERAKYARLVEEVQANGGDAVVFSGMLLHKTSDLLCKRVANSFRLPSSGLLQALHNPFPVEKVSVLCSGK